MAFAEPLDELRITVIDVVNQRLMRAADSTGPALQLTLADQYSEVYTRLCLTQ
jgi:hypothetical protein